MGNSRQSKLRRIAWVAPLPLKNYLTRISKKGEFAHAAPWITALMESIDKAAEIELDVFVPNTNEDDGTQQYGIRTHLHSVRLQRYRGNPLLALLENGTKISNAVASAKPDVVVVFGTEHIWSGALRDFFDAPVIYRLQGNLNECLRWDKTHVNLSLPQRLLTEYLALNERRIFKLGRHFIVQTPWDHAIVRRFNSRAQCYYEVCLPRTEYLINTVEESASAPRRRSTVVCVGNTTERKGIAELLETIALVRRELADVRFLVFGRLQSWVHEKYSRTIQALGESVQFYGSVGPSELIRELDTCTCFFNPTWIESYGMTNVEAQLRGAPLISSFTGGVPYLVEHRVDGLLCEPGRTDQYAQAILETLRDESAARRRACTARVRALQRHHGKTAAERHIANCRAALG